MTLAKDRVNPVLPRDIDNLKAEGYTSNKLSLGTLVVRDDNRSIRKCDTAAGDSFPDVGLSELTSAQQQDMISPVEIVWVDSTDRFDVTRKKSDGQDEYQITTIAFPFIADVDISKVFDNYSSPSAGDVIIKSTDNAGSMEVISPGQVDSQFDDHAANGTPADNLPSAYFDGFRVGYVVDGTKTDGMARCHFTLR